MTTATRLGGAAAEIKIRPAAAGTIAQLETAFRCPAAR